MIDALKGTIVDRGATHATLDTGSIVYHLDTPLGTTTRLATKRTVTIWCHLHVREDALRLFGFATREERDFFRMLIGVSGVGPGVALSLLSGAAPEDLRAAIATDDPGKLEGIRGVGPKTARRLIVELRDAVESKAAATGGPIADQVHRALVSLGYPAKVAKAAVAKALHDRPPGAPERNLEELLRAALPYAR